MSDQPASDLIFQATYCYYLEVMTETFNRRTDNLMNFCLSLLEDLLASAFSSAGCAVFSLSFFLPTGWHINPPIKQPVLMPKKSDIPDCLVISMRQVMLKSPDVWMNSKNSTVTLRPPSTTPQETELLSSFAAILNR